ncbi:hypothetical protein ASPWEDRAFT_28060 [Aspergillus wentii DTO 134E9]|uniref:Uncharacterized protein n=1 Tax=Aspergillus wentii DTO 134E9 TaxID=1073089 RepID=A0A1L9RKJ3_ASPWE|nr:uncharacterized protein ASPWEDRAFT_28060 [Aspergillus wentii DTO 134E9]OJJ35423.1 hypothetical protein ASPWEDRAFT_28060 [Aspergillus wentii DTO 134E9]
MKAARAAPARPTVSPTGPAVAMGAAASEVEVPDVLLALDDEVLESEVVEEEVVEVEVAVEVEVMPEDDALTEALVDPVTEALLDGTVVKEMAPELDPGMRVLDSPVSPAGVETAGCSEVATAGCEVAAASCEVAASGWPVTTPKVLVSEAKLTAGFSYEVSGQDASMRDGQGSDGYSYHRSRRLLGNSQSREGEEEERRVHFSGDVWE